MRRFRARWATPAAALGLALALAGCSGDDGSPAPDGASEPAATGGPTAQPVPTITLEAQTPGPLPSGFDADDCAVLAGVLEDLPQMTAILSPEDLYAAVLAAVQGGDMSAINEAGVEANALGARLRDNLDQAATVVDDEGVALALEGLADYYEDYLAAVAQMMATATSLEALQEDATAITLASEGLHAQAELDAEILEEHAETSCGEAIDVYTDPGIGEAA